MSRIYLSPPDMGSEEKALLLDAFDSNWIAPLGPHVDAFEEEFAEKVNSPHAVALSSGTAGLHLALVALGITQGDDVFCSTFTFAASANVIKYVGANPVFIDSDLKSWNMDPDLLMEELEKRAKINKLPKAVIVVHLYGQCADMAPILGACALWNIPVIEDAAEALGATYRGQSAGTLGTIGVFSFNGNKIITTSGGGMLVCKDKEIADKVKYLASQAKDPALWYEHSTVGYNYRLSNLLAAIGRGQLKTLDDKVKARQNNYNYYKENLKDVEAISFMPEASYGVSTKWLTCILLDSSKRSAAHVRWCLEQENIESRFLWKPMHMQVSFDSCQSVGGDVSKEFFIKGLCLPSGSNLTEKELERVVSVIKKACQ